MKLIKPELGCKGARKKIVVLVEVSGKTFIYYFIFLCLYDFVPRKFRH